MEYRTSLSDIKSLLIQQIKGNMTNALSKFDLLLNVNEAHGVTYSTNYALFLPLTPILFLFHRSIAPSKRPNPKSIESTKKNAKLHNWWGVCTLSWKSCILNVHWIHRRHTQSQLRHGHLLTSLQNSFSIHTDSMVRQFWRAQVVTWTMGGTKKHIFKFYFFSIILLSKIANVSSKRSICDDFFSCMEFFFLTNPVESDSTSTGQKLSYYKLNAGSAGHVQKRLTMTKKCKLFQSSQ